jgi:hypothetical protein
MTLGVAACKRGEEAAAPPAPPAAEAPKPAPAPTPAAAPFQVTGVEVGNAIGADKRVTTPTTTLAPSDTIYASVATQGTAQSVTLKARWTYEGDTLVKEDEVQIAPTGPAYTEFHVAKPDGWPAGKYQVQILANGAPAASKEFTVQ